MSSSCVFSPFMENFIILEAVKQLGFLIHELQELKDECGHTEKVDYVIENEIKELIGVRNRGAQGVELIVLNAKSQSAMNSANKIKQTAARIKVLNEAKQKGYQKVKEEKLPNGSIRLVVQKWR